MTTPAVPTDDRTEPVSDACAAEQLAAESRRERWLAENSHALDSYNKHVATNGLPLAKYRGF